MANEKIAIYTDAAGLLPDSFLSASVVLTTGTQTITGNKTFSGTTTLSSLTLSTALPIASGGTGQSTANAALNAFLPTQTSNSGKFLTTDGTNTSWSTISQGSNTYADNVFRIQDNGDATKQLAFEVSGVTTSTTRTLTVLDASGTVHLLPTLTYDTASSGAVTITGTQTKTYKYKPTTPLTANRTITLSTSGAITGVVVTISFVGMVPADFATFGFIITDTGANFSTTINVATCVSYQYSGSAWEQIL